MKSLPKSQRQDERLPIFRDSENRDCQDTVMPSMVVLAEMDKNTLISKPYWKVN